MTTTPLDWEKYSFPSREEYFRALEQDWQEHDDGLENEEGDEEGGDGEQGTGDLGLGMKDAQLADLWVFDHRSRSIHSKDGKRRISLIKLDTPSKVVRFLVTLEQRSDINPLYIIRALEQASQAIYDKPLTDILAQHATSSTRIDWEKVNPAPSLSSGL